MTNAKLEGVKGTVWLLKSFSYFNYRYVPWLKPFSHRNPFMNLLYSPCSLSLSVFCSSIWGLVRKCPHCGLTASGATTLSAISFPVLIWPLMGLDELGASLYTEREIESERKMEIHRTGRVEKTSLLSVIRSSFLQCTFLSAPPQLSLHHSNW